MPCWQKSRFNTKKWLFEPNTQIFRSKKHIFVPSGQLAPDGSLFSTKKRCLIVYLVNLKSKTWPSWHRHSLAFVVDSCLCVFGFFIENSRGVDILRPQRKKGPEMAEDGALGLGDAFFRLVWRKPLSESCFFVVNFGFSSSSLVRRKGDLDPLVSKVKRCFRSWGWQKWPPWHPRVLVVSRTLVWIDDISWFPVLVAIAQLLGWGGREPSQLETSHCFLSAVDLAKARDWQY